MKNKYVIKIIYQKKMIKIRWYCIRFALMVCRNAEKNSKKFLKMKRQQFVIVTMLNVL